MSMGCWRLTVSTLAVIASVAVADSARAADYFPPPMVAVPDFASGWYLRGYVGAGLNGAYSLDYITTTNATLQHTSNTDTFFLGAGFGYEWNNWLRFDGTIEYRAKSRVFAFVTYPPNGLDIYEGNINSWVLLANAFVDLGTWNCFTPFVGFGIGGALNSLSNFSDFNPNGGFGFGRNPSTWHFAYAAYLGVGYNINKNLKIDFTYRYLNHGSITDTVDCSVTCTHDIFKFGNLYSNDFMLGLRWTCCDLPPPPVLRSRG
jgi:opacity protein-like surface antigen